MARDWKPDDLLVKGEVADYCRVTERTVNLWMSSGIIRYCRLGSGAVRFRFKDVAEFLDKYLDSPGGAGLPLKLGPLPNGANVNLDGRDPLMG